MCFLSLCSFKHILSVILLYVSAPVKPSYGLVCEAAVEIKLLVFCRWGIRWKLICILSKHVKQQRNQLFPVELKGTTSSEDLTLWFHSAMTEEKLKSRLQQTVVLIKVLWFWGVWMCCVLHVIHFTGLNACCQDGTETGSQSRRRPKGPEEPRFTARLLVVENKWNEAHIGSLIWINKEQQQLLPLISSRTSFHGPVL